MTDLRALRDGLLEVHRELLGAQRIDLERIHGRMSDGDVLQAAVSDLRFDWLRPLSELAADIDAHLADPEQRADAAAAEALAARAQALVAPPDPDAPFGRQYLQALQRHPGVGVAHGRVAPLLA